MNKTTKQMINVSIGFSFILLIMIICGIIFGSADVGIKEIITSVFKSGEPKTLNNAIVWQIRLPRVLSASLTGAALSLGGLVFQALLRNPLAEPYILGVSGGSAIGAIIGIIIGLPYFPGVSLTAFIGSMATLFLVIIIASKELALKKDSLILAGVMINSFCSALIMFLISISDSYEIHNILFWLMGDLSTIDISQTKILAIMLLPCFIFFFFLSHTMNLIAIGKDMAKSMGVNIKIVILSMLIVCSFMISVTVCQAGLLGFVGLVMPHLLRLIIGSDHRALVPASILGGGAYMVLCDILSRAIPKAGEMPIGVITAIIGAPLFIILLKRSSK